MIALLRQVADPGTGEGARWAQMLTHMIKSDLLAKLGASSKLNAEREFVEMLKIEGRRAATEFLESHGEDLGKRSTANLDVLLEEC
jgi:NTE family protein